MVKCSLLNVCRTYTGVCFVVSDGFEIQKWNQGDTWMETYKNYATDKNGGQKTQLTNALPFQTEVPLP